MNYYEKKLDELERELNEARGKLKEEKRFWGKMERLASVLMIIMNMVLAFTAMWVVSGAWRQ